MTTEYRLVAERPPWQEGRGLVVAKRDAKKAAEGLRDWRRDMDERYEPNELDVWPAHIEARDVGSWLLVDEEDLPSIDPPLLCLLCAEDVVHSGPHYYEGASDAD